MHRLRIDRDNLGFLAAIVGNADADEFEEADDDAIRVRISHEYADGQTVAGRRNRRCFDGLYEDFVFVLEAGRKCERVDLHAVLFRNRGLFFRVSEVLVAIADEYDSLRGAFGERCERELQRGGDVGVLAVDRACHAVVDWQIAQPCGWQREAWPLAEEDDTGPIFATIDPA